jgi:hypothetical protein
MLNVGYIACAPLCGTHVMQRSWARRRTHNRLTLTQPESLALICCRSKPTRKTVLEDPLRFELLMRYSLLNFKSVCVQIVWNRSCQPAVLLLILFSSLINVASRRLIKLLENSNLGSPSWFALTLMTERLHEIVKFVQFFFRWSDEF